MLLIVLKLILCPSNVYLKNIFQLNWNSWLKSYIKHGNKLIILYQLLIVSRDRGKLIRDLTGLICSFYKKMDSVLKMSLSIEYQTKSDPPLTVIPITLCNKYCKSYPLFLILPYYYVFQRVLTWPNSTKSTYIVRIKSPRSLWEAHMFFSVSAELALQIAQFTIQRVIKRGLIQWVW